MPMQRPPRLQVRPLRLVEAGHVVRYFHDASDDDLRRMAVVDRTLLPRTDEWRKRLESAILAPTATPSTFYLAWLVDGAAIGHAAVKGIVFGEHAAIHLHMWSAAHRGKGLGARLFCLSVVDAYERFRLRRLVCEPSAGNPMPNRLLAKVGFPLERTSLGASSELSQTTMLNRYDVRLDVAQAFLARPAQRPPNRDRGVR